MIDSRAARPSTVSERTTSRAPAASTGIIHATQIAAVAAASAAHVATAVKHVVPQRVRRSRTIAVDNAAVAASRPLAADGPAGTARKPTKAAYTAATTLSAAHGNVSLARRWATAPTAAAAATSAPVTRWPYPRVVSPDHHSAAAPMPAAHNIAATAMIRGAGPRWLSMASATMRCGSCQTHRSAGASPALSTRRSPSRTLFSFNVIDSSSRDPPIRASRHRPTGAGSVSRRTRSTIDGTRRPTSASLGRARSTADDPSSPPP